MKSKPSLDRGVYELPFHSRSGHRMLVAVNSLGRRVTEALVFRRDSIHDVSDMLERILDQEDPQVAA